MCACVCVRLCARVCVKGGGVRLIFKAFSRGIVLCLLGRKGFREGRRKLGQGGATFTSPPHRNATVCDTVIIAGFEIP